MTKRRQQGRQSGWERVGERVGETKRGRDINMKRQRHRVWEDGDEGADDNNSRR